MLFYIVIIFHNINVLLCFNQINAALVIIEDFFKKTIRPDFKLLIPSDICDFFKYFWDVIKQ